MQSRVIVSDATIDEVEPVLVITLADLLFILVIIKIDDLDIVAVKKGRRRARSHDNIVDHPVGLLVLHVILEPQRLILRLVEAGDAHGVQKVLQLYLLEQRSDNVVREGCLVVACGHKAWVQSVLLFE